MVDIYEIKDNPAMIDKKIMYIIDICVDEKFKRNGYGQLIFTEIEEIAKLKNIHEIELDVFLFNKSAELFYKKCGFNEEKKGMRKILTTAST